MSATISNLVRAINRVGMRNVSALARFSGMPTETVRYNLKKRFPEFGLRVETNFRLEALGLQRYSGILTFSAEGLPHAASILDRLAHSGFLWYRSQVLLEPSHVVQFAVPVIVEDKFQRFLRRLVQDGILVDFQVTRMDWARNPELMCQYYDFSSGCWNIDWKEIATLQAAPPPPIPAEHPQPMPQIDRTDVLLIKELEANSLRTLESISRKLGMNPVTLRWHYRKHVVPCITHTRVSWIPSRGGDESKVVGVSFFFNQLHRLQLSTLRALFNNFPFAWYETGSSDGAYRADIAVPVEELIPSLDFLNKRIGAMALPTWRARALNPLVTMRYTIPYENFGEDNKWVFDPQAAWESILGAVRVGQR